MIPAMLLDIFKKKAPAPAGVSIVVLQRKLGDLSTDFLNRAMQRAWKQKFDAKNFCAYEGKEKGCPLLKAFGETFKVSHSKAALDVSAFDGYVELPPWAYHTSYATVQYDCPRIPESGERKKMYCVLGMLCHELINKETVGFFFTQEKVFARNTIALQFELSAGKPLDPYELANIAVRK